jgi:hypothetical protein
MSNHREPMSRGQGHEFLNKLEAAGLDATCAQLVIDSKGNDLASKVVRLIQNADPNWFADEARRGCVRDRARSRTRGAPSGWLWALLQQNQAFSRHPLRQTRQKVPRRRSVDLGYGASQLKTGPSTAGARWLSDVGQEINQHVSYVLIVVGVKNLASPSFISHQLQIPKRSHVVAD